MLAFGAMLGRLGDILQLLCMHLLSVWKYPSSLSEFGKFIELHFTYIDR